MSSLLLLISAHIVIVPKLITQQWPFWLHLLLVLLAAAYVWIRYSYKKRLQQLSNAFFTSRAVNQLFREESAGYSRLYIILSTFSFVVFSLFSYEACFIYGAHIIGRFGNDFFLLLSISAFIFLFYQAKIFVIKALGLIFKKESASEEYVFNITLFNQNLGLFLFPVVVGMAFLRSISPEVLLYGGLILTGLVFLYRLFRSLPWGIAGSIISKYYLFLYLCTLEILPLVVLMKAFVGEM